MRKKRKDETPVFQYCGDSGVHCGHGITGPGTADCQHRRAAGAADDSDDDGCHTIVYRSDL